MKAPQKLAARLYELFPTEELQNIKNNACCIFTLMWCLKLKLDDTEAIIKTEEMIKQRAIREDCTVPWDTASRFLTGHGLDVGFVNIDTIKGIKDRTPVCFVFNGKTHWVGVQRGRVRFDPLGKSDYTKKGKPAEKRVLTIQ